MIEGSNHSLLLLQTQMASRPYGAFANIDGKDGVVGGSPTHLRRDGLRVQRAVGASDRVATVHAVLPLLLSLLGFLEVLCFGFGP